MRSFLKFVVPALVLGVMSGSIIRADDQAAPPPPPPPGNQPPPPPSGPGGERRGRMDPAQQVQRLDAVLTLTDDQKAKATDIYKKMQTDMQALRSGAGTPEETMVKRQALQKSTHDQIRALTRQLLPAIVVFHVEANLYAELAEITLEDRHLLAGRDDGSVTR